MKTKIGMSFGLALTLVLGVFATMLALGMFTNNTGTVQASDSGTNVTASTITAIATPTDPGVPAKWAITFTTPSILVATVDSIIIEFEDDVGVPATLLNSEITITTNLFTNAKSGGTTGNVVANPLGVTVQLVGTPKDESRVTVEIGDMEPTTESPGLQGIDIGAIVTVIFRQSAGLTNPTEAKVGTGDYDVKVGTSHTASLVKNDSGNGVLIPRLLESNDAADNRGKRLTIVGRGFQNGTAATVWLDNGDGGGVASNGVQDGTEQTLGTVTVGGDDTFSLTFTVNAPPFVVGSSQNPINARDGQNNVAGNTVNFELEGLVKLSPTSAAIGDTVTITLKDWIGSATSDSVSDFTIGGVNVYASLTLLNAAYTITSAGDASWTFTVPDDARLGTQELKFNAGAETDTKNITIVGAPLQVVPDVVVPNQSVTISGQGFTKSQSISGSGSSGFFIGGVKIADDKVNDNKSVTIDASGNFVATVVMPVVSSTTSEGSHELKVIDTSGREGLTIITIAPRVITFTPAVSRIGSDVTITGSGYPGTNTKGSFNASVTIEYTLSGATSPATTLQVTPDTSGNFTGTIRVPLTAGIPSTNSVKVKYTDESSAEVSDTVAHAVPAATLDVSPNSGIGGTEVKVIGTGFKAFNTVTVLTIGGSGVLPSPNPSTDADGNWEATFLVPALDTGNQTVLATVGDTTANAGFTLTVDPVTAATPVPSAEQSTEDAFAAIIDNDVDGNPNLIGVFLFDNSTQAWTSFDPDPDFADFNDLTTVSGGKIVWVRVRSAQDFSGTALVEGWNQIVLP